MNNKAERKINPIKRIIHNKVMLAPMSGITDIAFRMIARRFGCRFAFTEMIDVNGIVYNNKRSLRLMERFPKDSPLGVQLIGQDVEKLLYVAKICEEKGFDVLDINAGCPARKVVKNGKGAALMKSPAKLAKIIHRLVKAVNMPVTVKIRSGWNDEKLNYMEIGKIVESEGASAIGIHSRTKEQMYKGMPDHEVTLSLKQALKIPVFASGDIFTALDAENIFETTGCDALFIARGALGRPWILGEIRKHLDGENSFSQFSFEDRKDIIMEHFSLSLSCFGKFLTLKRMYKHLAWYLKGYKNLYEIMKKYRKVESFESFCSFVKRLYIDDNNYLQLAT